ncbi:flagellar biosynthesis protein FlhB [Calderihabitans maritimus]|uniref:Flagellar biosynthetic protein FlhB n=1 Tax=Calderihabitans maritimus TaxID=1246530 RepID=A0A1Z5HTR7_9FIRM|nr:flagellar biosynthesis protein FlhB [Calderihabitans maritimus]GAW92933.1 flagellar biosynthetic protein FlhB [Calderihabitans maritimus]
MKYKIFPINLQLFAEEKTEEATPHRRQEVRKKGQVAKSTDLNASVVLMTVVLLLFMLQDYYIDQLSRYFTYLLSDNLQGQLSEANLGALATHTTVLFFKLTAPIFGVAIMAGLAVNLAQVGFLHSPEVIKPKLQNINPAEGFKRIFSRRSLVELVKAVLKVTIISLIILGLIKNRFQDLLLVVQADLYQGLALVNEVLFRTVGGVVLAFLVLALVDFVYQKFEFRQRIKMTRHEVKEELKQTEGDPHIRSRLREKQRELARHRMMQKVPEATVVITNPTHLAVALRYERKEMDAPVVVAKGAGSVARRIVEIAEEHEVPVVENKPLAQVLYRDVEIGEEIPPELYQAVAEVLAMLYSLKKFRL